jgi:hypothetical protein
MGGRPVKSNAVKAFVLPPTVTTKTLSELAVLFDGEPALQGA